MCPPRASLPGRALVEGGGRAEGEGSTLGTTQGPEHGGSQQAGMSGHLEAGLVGAEDPRWARSLCRESWPTEREGLTGPRGKEYVQGGGSGNGQ